MRLLLSEYLEPISFCLYFVVFLFYLSKVKQKLQYVVLCVYNLVATIIMAVAIHLEVNTQLYNLLYLLTTLSLGYYFYRILESRYKNIAVFSYIIVTLTYYTYSSVFFNVEIFFDSIGHVISSSGIVVLIFMYLNQVMTNVTDEPLSINFDFWFVCTQLFYHLGSFAIFLSYNYFTRKIIPAENYAENSTILTYLWVVHNVLLFLGALTTAYAIAWIYQKKLPSS